MTKDLDQLLDTRFSVGFPACDAEVLRALAHQRRISVSDLIRAATLRELDQLLPEAMRVAPLRAKGRST